MWAAAPCRSSPTGSSTATWAVFPPWHRCGARMGGKRPSMSNTGALATKPGAAAATCAPNTMPTSAASIRPICAATHPTTKFIRLHRARMSMTTTGPAPCLSARGMSLTLCRCTTTHCRIRIGSTRALRQSSPRANTIPPCTRRCAWRSWWKTTAASSASLQAGAKSVWLWTSGAPGTMWSRARIRASSTSRTRCAMRWWQQST